MASHGQQRPWGSVPSGAQKRKKKQEQIAKEAELLAKTPKLHEFFAAKNTVTAATGHAENQEKNEIKGQAPIPNTSTDSCSPDEALSEATISKPFAGVDSSSVIVVEDPNAPQNGSKSNKDCPGSLTVDEGKICL